MTGDHGRDDAFKYILDAISDGVYVVGPGRDEFVVSDGDGVRP